MDRTEVIERLEPLRQRRPIAIEHTPRTRVVLDGERAAIRRGSGTPLAFSEAGRARLHAFIGVTPRTMERLSVATRQTVANELLARQGRYVLFQADGEVVDITPPGALVPVEPERLTRAIERVIPEPDYSRLLVDGNTASLELVGRDLRHEHPVRVGDVVRSGVRLRFSPIGTIMPQVTAFFLRLACTNGALSGAEGGGFEWSGEGSSGLYDWFRNSIRQVVREAGRGVEEYRRMAETAIAPEARAHVLEGLIRQAGLTGTNAATVRARALEAPPETEWEAFNLLTWATSHVLEDPCQVARAQLAAARWAGEMQHRTVCPACGATH